LSAGSLKKRLHDYENQPSSEEERRKYKSIVEKTVKERSKVLAELVVRLTLITVHHRYSINKVPTCRTWSRKPFKISQSSR
jgi:hypothetical protein